MTLIEALHSLYPDAEVVRDFIIVDRGQGPYLDHWHLDVEQPTQAELLAVGYDGPYLTPQEAHMAQRENDFITEARIANRQIWEGINKLKALQREYNALDYGSTLDEGTSENAGITAAHVGAVVFDTATALEAVLAAGHATNMARLL